jgi:DNA-binding beta-propeller fold protein YncE
MNTISLSTYLLAFTLLSSAAPSAFPSPSSAEKKGSLTFIREFSSAEDVKGVAHPILNKTIDIIAGPADPSLHPGSMLQQPYAVTTDSNHRIFATDIAAGLVHVFDFANHEYSVLGSGNHLRAPLGVASDREGNVYVSDVVLRTVLMYDAKGKFIRYLKKPRGDESYFDGPLGIAVDPVTEHIFVCDTPRHMVIILDKKGHVIGSLGKRGGGTGPGDFNHPTQVAADAGEILVLDSGNSRLQIVDQQGHFRREIQLANVGRGAGLAVDGIGDIYLTDPDLNNLQAFSRDGQRLYIFGQTGKDAGQFNGLSGAWVDSGHCLYLVDTQNRRVQLFQIAGLGTGGCSF